MQLLRVYPRSLSPPDCTQLPIKGLQRREQALKTASNLHWSVMVYFAQRERVQVQVQVQEEAALQKGESKAMQLPPFVPRKSQPSRLHQITN